MIGVLVMLVEGPLAAEGRRLSETCDGSNSLGDKWFDGCQWCVCTVRGVHCSSSDCSGLVQKVAPCHEMGQRWNDGCYRCKCKRHGIRCRLDTTCLLLRHYPIPCLADHRCVCGPDGVPSCTAEVIDRHAFSARRVDLGFPTYLAPEGRQKYPDFRKNGDEVDSNEAFEGNILDALEGGEKAHDFGSSSQELLIMSDNMCRFGPRWYGGSLRCFCDIDGSITCGNPTFVTAFIDDFSVRREACEENHVWEEGCSVCSCRLNGVVFCRRSRDCRHQINYDDDDDDDNFSDIDHYLPLDVSEPSVVEIAEPTTPVAHRSEPTTAHAKATRRPPMECIPGTHWQDGCARCHCTITGRAMCSRRHCPEEKQKDRVEDTKKPQAQHGQRDTTTRRDNHAKPADATLWPDFPRGPRGPMMVPPPPANVYRPPAYLAPSKEPTGGCGKFIVGQKFWKECNLCLCTSHGPKCQAKLCR